MHWLILTTTFGFAQSARVGAERIADACRTSIPPSIERSLTQRFSAYRLPLVTDNLKDDVRLDLDHGGNGCLLVASGDFDGDGHNDFAVGLTPKRGHVPLIAVALARGSGWAVSTVQSWVNSSQRLYECRSARGSQENRVARRSLGAE
jgi:hypothetical protein